MAPEQNVAMPRPAPSPKEVLEKGSVWCAQGRSEEARGLYEQALLTYPDSPELKAALAALWAGEHQRDRAVRLYREALDLQPAFAEAHANLGVLLMEAESTDEAAHHLQLALALKDNQAEPWCNLGHLLMRRGQFDRAIVHYRRAVELRNDLVPALNNLGALLLQTGRPKEAVGVFEQLVRYHPKNVVGWSHLAFAWQALGSPDKVIEVLERAIESGVEGPEIRLRLAEAYRLHGMPDQAVSLCRDIVLRNPRFEPAYVRLGEWLAMDGMPDQALDLYGQALDLDPNDALAHFRMGCLLLLTGRYDLGWPEYRWRRQCGFASTSYRHPLTGPEWQGQALEGKRIFVYCEQGLGDVVQFVRYLPLLKSRGATVLFEVPIALRGLMSRCPWIDDLLTYDPKAPSLVTYDLHISIMNLPDVFRTTVETLPHTVPYLQADPDLVRPWRTLIGSEGLKVGLVWAGNPRHPDDANRSCPVEAFARLSSVPSVRLFSIQKGEQGASLNRPEADPHITDLGPRLQDFADTAAAMACLDLVISVDTAPAHLAGALARPVWMLLPFAPDWRWMVHRTDSPWYPTMRLYRQPKAGDWESVLAAVHRDLRALDVQRSP